MNYQKAGIEKNVMDGVELDNVKFWYIENITKTGNLWYHHHFWRYHNFLMALKTFDKLEISTIALIGTYFPSPISYDFL